MARTRNDRDSDAVAELILHLVALVRRLERILLGLQIEQRRMPAGPPVRLFDRGDGRALRIAYLRVPSVEPAARIIAGREERKAQRCEPLGYRL